jgi:hypothetical protein
MPGKVYFTYSTHADIKTESSDTAEAIFKNQQLLLMF